MLLKREMDVDNDSDGHLQRALPLLGKTPDTHRQASMYRLLSVIISCSGYTVNVVAVSGDVTYNYALHAQAIQPRHSYYLTHIKAGFHLGLCRLQRSQFFDTLRHDLKSPK